MKLCAVAECSRPSQKRGWCGTHYHRWFKYGDPLRGGALPEVVATACAYTGCDLPTFCRGWCSAHYSRWLRRGDPAITIPSTGAGACGAEARHWKGTQITYGGAHDRVVATRGSARTHRCDVCRERPAAHWAYDHADPDEVRGIRLGRSVVYSGDPEHYLPMCPRCHVNFDLNHRAVEVAR